MVTSTWSSEELEWINAAGELDIAVQRADGSLRRWTPIWVVCVDRPAYVRTWYRRDTGWFGQALRSRRARIRVPGLEVNVAVEDVGEGAAERRASIDAAYTVKYGNSGSSSMVTVTAAATTLRLTPERVPHKDH